jgi:hypothetical protein
MSFARFVEILYPQQTEPRQSFERVNSVLTVAIAPPMPSSASHHNGIFAASAFTRPAANQTLTCSILVVGASTAAYAAALTILKYSQLDVCLVQPYNILGGQFTTQGLPASDDSNWIQKKATADTINGEQFAISRSQRLFRERQRSLQQVKGQRVDNPGGGWVSPLCTTPVVAATALNDAIAPYLAQQRLRLIPHSLPIDVLMQQDREQPRRVTGVRFQDTERQLSFTVLGKIVIEATDLGDLLELGKISSYVGQESRQQTGEQILPADARPRCQQSFTYCALVEQAPASYRAVVQPPTIPYGNDPFTATFYKRSGTSWKALEFFHDFGTFRYRRVYRLEIEEKVITPGDITTLNWGVSHDPDGKLYCGNDYRPGQLVGVSPEERQAHLQAGRSRAQAYIHYLQTHGVANLKPRGDLTWTADGIAIAPYVREARRAQALTTIRHEDIAAAFFPNQIRARSFTDSVGIGHYYYIDLHGNDAAGHITPLGDYANAKPFTLPLGALVPVDTDGCVLSSKSIGTTHITNAAYRMHPIEWAIGEASGFLAVFSIWTGQQPRAIVSQVAQVRRLQGFLTRNGIPIFWFDDVGHDDPDFEPIQVLAAAGIVRSEDLRSLHFRPQASVNRAVACAALVNLLSLPIINPSTPRFTDVPRSHWAYGVIETLAHHGLISGVGDGRFAPDQPMIRQHLAFLIDQVLTQTTRFVPYDVFIRTSTPKDQQVVQRRDLSRILYELLKIRLGIAA